MLPAAAGRFRITKNVDGLLLKPLDRAEHPKLSSSSSVRSGIFIGPGVVYGILRSLGERNQSLGDQDKGRGYQLWRSKRSLIRWVGLRVYK